MYNLKKVQANIMYNLNIFSKKFNLNCIILNFFNCTVHMHNCDCFKKMYNLNCVIVIVFTCTRAYA